MLVTSGHKFPIGPFHNAEEAKQALDFYNITKNAKPSPKDIDPNREVYYLMFIIKRVKGRPPFKIERRPGNIVSGKAQDFDNYLSSNLANNIMTIGPFWNKKEAEEAKKLYQ